jgi:hypothetical protein
MRRADIGFCAARLAARSSFLSLPHTPTQADRATAAVELEAHYQVRSARDGCKRTASTAAARSHTRCPAAAGAAPHAV